MRKFFPLLVVSLFCCVTSANAQVARLQARNAEWKSYALPQTNFARQTTPDKELIFRVPADWKQEGTDLIFTGPHSAKIQLFIQKVPSGYPLQEFFGSMVRAVQNNPAATESTVTRRTQLQDLEAREILVEVPNPEGEITRGINWTTVTGPLAVTFYFQVPAAYAAETEPFFKAVVQSVMFLPPDYSDFELIRSENIKSPAPGPINDIESIVAAVSETNADHEPAVTRLAALFASQPDVAIDLLVDRRPFVRLIAVQALARSDNKTLTPFLWKMVGDLEPLVAEAAARSVAQMPDVVTKVLENSIRGLRTDVIARVWPFMTKDKRVELLQLLFSETAMRPTPPPAVAPPPPKVPSKGTVVIIDDAPPVRRGVTVGGVEGLTIPKLPNVQIGALTLLAGVPVDEFKLPLARVMASNYEPLISLALQVANIRGESLPVDSLFKLVANPDPKVNMSAARSFGWSSNVSDIPRIEALISKEAKKPLDDELRLSIRKIQFRNRLSTAKSASEQREIISKALTDSSLADFAWRYDCEATVAGCTPTALKRDFTIKPLGENLFPKKVVHYTAIPDPGQVVDKFYGTLHGLQMESPRAQSSLVLMMGGVRQMLADTLSAPADAEKLIDYTGIDPDSPIALGVWTADKALDSTALARRRAIVLRVKDRSRFERLVERFQQTGDSFLQLTDYVAAGTRMMAALPALLPFTAEAVLSVDRSKPSTRPLLKYALVGEKEWNGLDVKTIEYYVVNSEARLEFATTHMVFIGDTVVLAPDLATVRDLLGDAQPNRQYLADNTEFRKAIENRGDIVYFSDLPAVFANASGKKERVDESGALNITNSSWENTHHLVFNESDWSKPLLPFDPKELSAPRDLLPASTIAYYLTKVDLASAWTTYSNTLFSTTNSETFSNVWALDFKQDVLPELGPECGVAVLELPRIKDLTGGTVAIFCKLKSSKLAGALTAGKLLRGVGPTSSFAQVKAGGDDSLFVAARNGFLIVSNREKGLAALDGKSNLAATRDYSRTVAKVPSGIVALGGYNLEAAVAAASNGMDDGLRAAVAKVLFSIASAFHSQNFYATASAGTVEARSSVAMDREGRYAVADVSFLPRGTNITFATLEPSGVPITDQNRLSSVVLRIKAKATGPIEDIKDDVKSAHQVVEEKSANELLLTIAARRASAEKTVELPVKDPEFAPYLAATLEFPAGDKNVMERAREIAGTDRDAWSVARKLADWIHQNLEWKLVSSASAGETLATREADCSEFSDLFVAMARSLGLPARTVSGIAYTGNSFGGHAWVEVWAGKWIELDPTWGTHFVDATHIRNNSTALITSAALNLIEIEVLETHRPVADFQRSSKALTEHLVKVIPAKDKSEIEAAIDLPMLTDEFMGAGAWSKMNDAERDQMVAGYRAILNEILSSYEGYDTSRNRLRLMHLEEKGDVAEAICLQQPYSLLVKLRLARRNDVWYLVEITHADTNLHIVSEMLQPRVATVEKTRRGEKGSGGQSDYLRVLLLFYSNAAKALEVADQALKVTPDKNVRFLRALALNQLEKTDEARKALRELSNEAYAPAVRKLADVLSSSEDVKERTEAIALYERYLLLEPHDPRVFSNLATAYESAGDLVKAEASYRKALESDFGNSDNHKNLIVFLIRHDRVGEAQPVLATADKQFADSDLFGSTINDLVFMEEYKAAEKLAASEPARMKTSVDANLAMGRLYSTAKRNAEALRAFNTAAQLDKTLTYPYVGLASVYRQMSNWNAALKSAQQAISMDAEYSEAHYQRACALARLGRTKEAMAALEKAVELDPDQSEYIADEKDLKPLASLPAFKKLLPQPEKP
jgi:tetratricopeptide (TPR) repeat protein